MTAVAVQVRRGGSFIRSRLSRFWSGISAVSIKELRGRMRGRRAFVVLTIYLLLLGLFAFAIYIYLKQQAAQIVPTNVIDGMPRDFPGSGQTLANGTALSAGIGHGIFGGLLFLETLLVLVLAPAFTSGAISLEREKQTIDLLVTTPLSTLGMVIGKLFSALSYVFLLIIASIPLASLVFVFGGVGPEDLVRAYLFLFALAFGMGAIGLFISALVRRTQTATVVTFVVVLLLSIGTAAGHQFWQVATKPTGGSSILVSNRGKAPEAALWLNPFVAGLDMICSTSPDAYHLSCDYVSDVTGKPYFGSPITTQPGFGEPAQPFVNGGDDGFDIDGRLVAPECPPNAACEEPAKGILDCAADMVSCNDVFGPGVGPGGDVQQQVVSFGFPRDTFWPKSAVAFLVLGVALTLASAQLVSPTRRLRLPRPRLPRRGNRMAVAASDTPPAATVDDTVEAVPTEAVTVAAVITEAETTESEE